MTAGSGKILHGTNTSEQAHATQAGVVRGQMKVQTVRYVFLYKVVAVMALAMVLVLKKTLKKTIQSMKQMVLDWL